MLHRLWRAAADWACPRHTIATIGRSRLGDPIGRWLDAQLRRPVQ